MSNKTKVIAILGVVAAGVAVALASGKLERLCHSAKLTIDDVICSLS